MFKALQVLFFRSSKDKFLRRRIASIFGVYPRNVRLYELALIHKSASIVLPDGQVVNNERLEYLGDAVLDTVIADFLYTRFPGRNEGFLSQMRSKIVKRKHLNELAIRLLIPELLVSNTEPQTTKHIFGDAFEALVGALYLDRGYAKTRHCIIHNIVEKHVSLEQLELTETDFKSRLIEWAQKHKCEISFESHIDYGDSDNISSFVASVTLDGQPVSMGHGTAKKEAEQNAAENAYIELSGRADFQNF